MAKRVARTINSNLASKKRYLKIVAILGALFLLVGGAILLVWNNDSITRTQLDTPSNLKIEQIDENVVLKFSPIEGACGYEVIVNGVVESLQSKQNQLDITALVKDVGDYSISVQALGGELYKNSEISQPISYHTYMSLIKAQPYLSELDKLILWPEVAGADYYFVSIDGVLQEQKCYTNCFDYSKVVTQYGKNYAFSVVAVHVLGSGDEVKSTSLEVKVSISNTFVAPTILNIDETKMVFSWDWNEQTKQKYLGLTPTYTVFIYKNAVDEEGNLTGEKELVAQVKSNVNSLNFSNYIQSGGKFEFCVKVNELKNGQNVVYYESEISNSRELIAKTKLQTPVILTPKVNKMDVVFQWQPIVNALEYVFEVVDDNDVCYYQSIANANSIYVSRNVSESMSNIMRVRVYAKGSNLYTNSDYSDIVSIDVSDQMASPKNVTVIETSGKRYLTFENVVSNKAGDVSLQNHNGYTYTIQAISPVTNLVEKEYVKTTKLNYIDITDYTVDYAKYSLTSLQVEGTMVLYTYKISVFCNAYSYYKESDKAYYSCETDEGHIAYADQYSPKVQVNKVLDQQLYLESSGEKQKLIFKWKHIPNAIGYEVSVKADLDGDNSYPFYISYVSNSSQKVETSKIFAQQAISSDILTIVDGYFYCNIRALYLNGGVSGEKKRVDILQSGQSICVCVRVLGSESQFMIDALKEKNPNIVNNDGVYFNNTKILNSDWGKMLEYKNYVQLESPIITSIVSGGENSNWIMSFTAVNNASYYQIRVKSQVSMEEVVFNSSFTTVKIDDYLTLGDNLISVCAVGIDYYTTSPDSETVSVTYEIQLQAPSDLSVQFNEQTQKYELTFFAVRFASAYNVKIRKTNSENWETIYYPTKSSKVCIDIDDKVQQIGEYEIQAQALGDEIYGELATDSEWSNPLFWLRLQRLDTPINLTFNYNTEVLSWVDVDFATNGYVIQVQLNNAVKETIASFESQYNSIDLSNFIESLDNYGDLSAKVKAKSVIENFYKESEYSDVCRILITRELTAPADFEFNSINNILSWSVDTKSDFDTLKIYFSTQDSEKTLVLELDENQKYSNHLFDFSTIFNQYGAGYFDIEIVSHSNNALLLDSQMSSFQSVKTIKLQAPILKSVNFVDDKLLVTFSKSQNGLYYSILAKNMEQSDYVEIVIEVVWVSQEQTQMSVDIYKELAEIMGAGELKIAVRADKYAYYEESDLSNEIDYEFRIKHYLPTNLVMNDENGQYILEWDSDETVESWNVIVDNTIPRLTNENSIDVTDFFSTKQSGIYELNVRANENGFWLASNYATIEYILVYKIEKPIVEYDEETKTLIIDGDKNYDNGYSIKITCGDQEIIIHNTKLTDIPLDDIFEKLGPGKYVIEVIQKGDDENIISKDSEIAKIIIDYVIPLDNPESFVVVTNFDGSEKHYNINVVNNPELFGLVTMYQFYLIDDSENYDLSILLPSNVIYSVQSEFNIDEYLLGSKYYCIVAQNIGMYEKDNQELYKSIIGDGEVYNSLYEKIAYYTNSIGSQYVLSTFGEQLATPVINNVSIIKIDNVEYIEVVFANVENAENYALKVVRLSGAENEDYGVIFDNEVVGTVGETTTVVVPCKPTGTTYEDNFDIYLVQLFAKDVYIDEQLLYKASLQTQINYEYIAQLKAPSVNINVVDGDMYLTALFASSEDAKGVVQYVFNVDCGGVLIQYSSETNLCVLKKCSVGNYSVSAKAVGDLWHKDSEFGAISTKKVIVQLGSVSKLEIVATLSESGEFESVVAKWDKVVDAVFYDLQIVLGNESWEYKSIATNQFSLLSALEEHGAGDYIIYVKTANNSEFVIGEKYYKCKAQFSFKYVLEIPEIVEIYFNDNGAELLDYYLKWKKVLNAEDYTLYIYDSNDVLLSGSTLIIKKSDIDFSNVGCCVYKLSVLNTFAGGNYKISIKANETWRSKESQQSASIAFDYLTKYKNANLRVEQVYGEAELYVKFNNLADGIRYSLKVNGEYYLMDGKIDFGYVESIQLLPKDLLIGENNFFELIVWGEPTIYTYTTSFNCEYLFKFQLSEPIINNISQQSKYKIASEEDAQIIVDFDLVAYATDYAVYIDGVDSGLRLTSDNKDISSLFTKRLPGQYELILKALNSEKGLSSEFGPAFEFTYELILNSLEDVEVFELNDVFVSWSEPTNVSVFRQLYPQLQIKYEISIIYIDNSGTMQFVVIPQELDKTKTIYNLSQICVKAGNYSIQVKAKVSDSTIAVQESGWSDYVDFMIVKQIPAPTNAQVEIVQNNYFLSFNDSQFDDSFAIDASIVYKVFINGSELETRYKSGTPKIDITQHLFGGENLICIQAFDLKHDYLLPSEKVYVSGKIVYSQNWTTLENLSISEIFKGSGKHQQKLIFNTPKAKGLSNEDLQQLTYRVDACTNGGKWTTLFSNSKALVYDLTQMYFDVSEYVNNTSGTYKFRILVNNYSKQITVDGNSVTLSYLKSDYAQLEYIFVVRANTIENMDFVVYSKNQKGELILRETGKNQIMYGFDLYFEFNMPNYIADKYYFVVEINGKEYQFTSGIVKHELNGVMTDCCVVNVFEILQNDPDINLNEPAIYKFRVRSIRQGSYKESLSTLNTTNYIYDLPFIAPVVEFIDNSAREIAVDADYLLQIQRTKQPVEALYLKISGHDRYSEQQVVFEEILLDKHISGEPEIHYIEKYMYLDLSEFVYPGYNTIEIRYNGIVKYLFGDSNMSVVETSFVYRQIKEPQINVTDFNENSISTDDVKIRNLRGFKIEIVGGLNTPNSTDFNLDVKYKIVIDELTNTTDYHKTVTTEYINGVLHLYDENGLEIDSSIMSGRYKNGITTIDCYLKSPGVYSIDVKAIGIESEGTLSSKNVRVEHSVCFKQQKVSIADFDSFFKNQNGTIRDNEKDSEWLGNIIAKLQMDDLSDNLFSGLTITISCSDGANLYNATIVLQDVRGVIEMDFLNDIYSYRQTTSAEQDKQTKTYEGMKEILNNLIDNPSQITFSIIPTDVWVKYNENVYKLYEASDKCEKNYNYTICLSHPTNNISIIGLDEAINHIEFENDVEKKLYKTEMQGKEFLKIQVDPAIVRLTRWFDFSFIIDVSSNLYPSSTLSSKTTTSVRLKFYDGSKYSFYNGGYYYYALDTLVNDGCLNMWPGENQITLKYWTDNSTKTTVKGIKVRNVKVTTTLIHNRILDNPTIKEVSNYVKNNKTVGISIAVDTEKENFNKDQKYCVEIYKYGDRNHKIVKQYYFNGASANIELNSASLGCYEIYICALGVAEKHTLDSSWEKYSKNEKEYYVLTQKIVVATNIVLAKNGDLSSSSSGSSELKMKIDGSGNVVAQDSQSYNSAYLKISLDTIGNDHLNETVFQITLTNSLTNSAYAFTIYYDNEKNIDKNILVKASGNQSIVYVLLFGKNSLLKNYINVAGEWRVNLAISNNFSQNGEKLYNDSSNYSNKFIVYIKLQSIRITNSTLYQSDGLGEIEIPKSEANLNCLGSVGELAYVFKVSNSSIMEKTERDFNQNNNRKVSQKNIVALMRNFNVGDYGLTIVMVAKNSLWSKYYVNSDASNTLTLCYRYTLTEFKFEQAEKMVEGPYGHKFDANGKIQDIYCNTSVKIEGGSSFKEWSISVTLSDGNKTSNSIQINGQSSVPVYAALQSIYCTNTDQVGRGEKDLKVNIKPNNYFYSTSTNSQFAVKISVYHKYSTPTISVTVTDKDENGKKVSYLKYNVQVSDNGEHEFGSYSGEGYDFRILIDGGVDDKEKSYNRTDINSTYTIKRKEGINCGGTFNATIYVASKVNNYILQSEQSTSQFHLSYYATVSATPKTNRSNNGNYFTTDVSLGVNLGSLRNPNNFPTSRIQGWYINLVPQGGGTSRQYYVKAEGDASARNLQSLLDYAFSPLNQTIKYQNNSFNTFQPGNYNYTIWFVYLDAGQDGVGEKPKESNRYTGSTTLNYYAGYKSQSAVGIDYDRGVSSYGLNKSSKSSKSDITYDEYKNAPYEEKTNKFFGYVINYSKQSGVLVDNDGEYEIKYTCNKNRTSCTKTITRYSYTFTSSTQSNYYGIVTGYRFNEIKDKYGRNISSVFTCSFTLSRNYWYGGQINNDPIYVNTNNKPYALFSPDIYQRNGYDFDQYLNIRTCAENAGLYSNNTYTSISNVTPTLRVDSRNIYVKVGYNNTSIQDITLSSYAPRQFLPTVNITDGYHTYWRDTRLDWKWVGFIPIYWEVREDVKVKVNWNRVTAPASFVYDVAVAGIQEYISISNIVNSSYYCDGISSLIVVQRGQNNKYFINSGPEYTYDNNTKVHCPYYADDDHQSEVIGECSTRLGPECDNWDCQTRDTTVYLDTSDDKINYGVSWVRATSQDPNYSSGITSLVWWSR